jgi:hypothetical protein
MDIETKHDISIMGKYPSVYMFPIVRRTHNYVQICQ